MELIFEEKQKIRQKWLIGIVFFSSFVMIAVFGYGIYQQIILGIPFGNKPASDTFLLLVGGLILLVSVGIPVLLLKAVLETKIYDDGIYFRYVPFIMKYRKINMLSVQSYEIKKYRPIRDFGGWGIRFSFKGKNIVYNVSGDMGLELVLQTGKIIILGTQKPDEIGNALRKALGR